MKLNTRHFDQKMINYCTKAQKVITEMAGDNILLQIADHRDLKLSPILSPGKSYKKHSVKSYHREITTTIIRLLKSLTLSPSKKGESGDNRVK